MSIRTLFLALVCASALSAQSKLLRYPDIHGDKVVFSYGGDLWTASSNGGSAARLTAHPGLELFPKFSPDGKWIAFTGQYEGDEQVYVIPVSGGAPKQLTYYPAKGPLPTRWGYDNQVQGWTPDGKKVVFRSMRQSMFTSDQRLYAVPAEGGLPEPLPMPEAGSGDYSPDGKRILYSPLFRDFRHWKRYQGGWAQDLYIFDPATRDVTAVNNSPRTERDPMWIGDKVYYSSDRTGTLNLFEYDPASKKVRQLTNSTDWDVRWPSKGDKTQIVYELAGELWVIDVAKGAPRKLSISVPSEGLNTRTTLIQAGQWIENTGLSPKGERALFAARGDIFTVPIEKGVPRNLTRSSDAHDKAPTWSPDGRMIAYISDRSGEEEIWHIPQDGSKPAEQITRGNKEMLFRPTYSPDSKKIAYSNKSGKVFVVNLADKSQVEVADESRGQLQDYTWSPDSNYLAFSMTTANSNNNNSIYIWSANDKQLHKVSTSEMFNESQPAWDPDGNYLYFLSERDYQPIISNVEFNFAGARSRGIFALALRKDVKHPFPPESDEVTVAPDPAAPKPDAAKPDAPKPDAAKPDAPKPDAAKPSAVKPLNIDFDGLGNRVARFPLPGANYFGLTGVKGGVIFVRGGNPYYGRESDAPTQMVLYTMKDRKDAMLVDNFQGGAISEDGNKILARLGPGFQLIDVPSKGQVKKPVSTANMMYEKIPQQEFTQIFNEVWRRYRDYFYVKNMHGYDWEKLRDQYKPWLEYVGHRDDLNYIISEMIGELNVGHAYIQGGDWQQGPRPNVGLLGADLDLDEASGRYRVGQILEGQNQEPTYRSPLTEIGVNVKKGDYLLAIDGVELTRTMNPYRLLVGKANQQVRLTVNSRPDMTGAREVVVQTIPSEENLYYLKFVETNRKKVEQATNGRIGYIHIPNMGAEGIREFVKQYYPQVRKEGLIVDVRANGGGNISQMIIERLRRTLLGAQFARTNDTAGTYPGVVFTGPMVCLLNQTSASDGDIFPAMFRQAGLGPLIGKRSWGGVVGITNRGNLIDGGVVNVPEFGLTDPNGNWIIEGIGVPPDIEVDNDPKSVIDGKDPQLERGIAEVMKAVATKGKKLPNRPPDPVKTPEALKTK
jgi:tricorn protease